MRLKHTHAIQIENTDTIFWARHACLTFAWILACALGERQNLTADKRWTSENSALNHEYAGGVNLALVCSPVRTGPFFGK